MRTSRPASLIPLEGIGADGAETPEAAVDGVLDRVEALDLTGLLRTLNPGEAAALQRYAPLFLDDADAVLDDVAAGVGDHPPRVPRGRVRRHGDGVPGRDRDRRHDRGRVVQRRVRRRVRPRPRRPASRSSSAPNGRSRMRPVSSTSEPELERFIETLTEAFADIEPVGLELRRTDGLWYVSPISTVTEGILAVLRALDRGELDAIIEQAPAAGEAFGDAIFGGLDDLTGGGSRTERVRGPLRGRVRTISTLRRAPSTWTTAGLPPEPGRTATPSPIRRGWCVLRGGGRQRRDRPSR